VPLATAAEARRGVRTAGREGAGQERVRLQAVDHVVVAARPPQQRARGLPVRGGALGRR
jgi:hypothetical protein